MNYIQSISSKILNSSQLQHKKYLLLGALLVHIVVFAGMGFKIFDIKSSYETISYLRAADNIIENGFPDMFRTPVYPFLLWSMNQIFGETAGAYATVVLQFIIFLGSIILLYNTLEMLLPKRRLITLAVSAFYAYNPEMAIQTLLRHTEGISLALTIAMTFFALRAYRNSSIKDGAIATALNIIMLLTRPFFLCFMPGVFFIAFASGIHCSSLHKRLAFFLMPFLVLGSYLCYCHVFEQKFGVFTMSSVSHINKKEELWEAGIKYPTNPVTNSFKSDVAYIDSVLWANRYQYGKYALRNFYESQQQVYPRAICFGPDSLNANIIPGLRIADSYLIFLLFTGIALWRLIRYRRNIIVEFFLITIVSATFFTNIVASFGDFSRLNMPIFGALCLMTALLLSDLIASQRIKNIINNWSDKRQINACRTFIMISYIPISAFCYSSGNWAISILVVLAIMFLIPYWMRVANLLSESNRSARFAILIIATCSIATIVACYTSWVDALGVIAAGVIIAAITHLHQKGWSRTKLITLGIIAATALVIGRFMYLTILNPELLQTLNSNGINGIAFNILCCLGVFTPLITCNLEPLSTLCTFQPSLKISTWLGIICISVILSIIRRWRWHPASIVSAFGIATSMTSAMIFGNLNLAGQLTTLCIPFIAVLIGRFIIKVSQCKAIKN